MACSLDMSDGYYQFDLHGGSVRDFATHRQLDDDESESVAFEAATRYCGFQAAVRALAIRRGIPEHLSNATINRDLLKYNAHPMLIKVLF